MEDILSSHSIGGPAKWLPSEKATELIRQSTFFLVLLCIVLTVLIASAREDGSSAKGKNSEDSKANSKATAGTTANNTTGIAAAAVVHLKSFLLGFIFIPLILLVFTTSKLYNGPPNIGELPVQTASLFFFGATLVMTVWTEIADLIIVS